MVRQGAIRLGALALRDFQFVPQLDGGNAKEFFIGLNATLDFGFQMIGGRDSARFQRAGQCARQSTGERRDDMIDRCRQRSRVLYSVIFCIAAVSAEVQRLTETLDVRLAERPLLLYQPDARSVNQFTHRTSSRFRFRVQQKDTAGSDSICRIESVKKHPHR